MAFATTREPFPFAAIEKQKPWAHPRYRSLGHSGNCDPACSLASRTSIQTRARFSPQRPILMEILSAKLLASRQLEAGNASLPGPGVGRRSADLVVLVDVPERAIVHGIDVQRGVVTPP